MSIRSVIEIRYAQIRSLDLSNGEGVGVALFVQGCHFHCKNCFNPETWDFYGGKEWTEETKERFLELVDRPYIKRVSLLGGECLAEENLDDVLDLVTEVNKRYNTTQDTVHINNKNNNILNENANKIRLSSPKKSIWLYTGYTICFREQLNKMVLSAKTDDYHLDAAIPTVIREKILEECDIVVDGNYIDSQRDITLPYRGSSNQRLINIQQSLQKGKIVLWKI